MLQKVKFIVLLILLNIVITNNNIKISYNSIIMKSSKNKCLENVNKTKTREQDVVIKNIKGTKSGENLKVIEVAKEWAINKENEIIKETSMFTNITEIMKKKLANVSLRPNTVHLVIKYIMELIEETPIKGVEQKEFALKVMRELFKDLTEGEDETVLLKLLDDGSISNIIDLVVDATNGKINVNAAIETSVQCVTTCLPYCMKSKSKRNKAIK